MLSNIYKRKRNRLNEAFNKGISLYLYYMIIIECFMISKALGACPSTCSICSTIIAA